MTDHKTIKILARVLINRLEHGQVIEYDSMNRNDLTVRMSILLGKMLITEEEVSDKAKAIVDRSAKTGQEFDAEKLFESAKDKIIGTFEGEEINGLFLKESLHSIVKRLTQYLMEEDLIDDVFLPDEEIKTILVKEMKTFNPEQVS